MQINSRNPAPLAYGSTQACLRLGIGKTQLFALISKGDLSSFTVGNRRMVTEDECQAFLARRVAAAQAGA